MTSHIDYPDKVPEKKTLLTELHYLPSLEFFCHAISANKIIVEAHEHYQKQSYRNRCYINTDKGVQLLTVPIIKPTSKMKARNIEIDYKTRWQNVHWRTIQSAYAKAPYFEHYSESLKKIIYQKHLFLFDLNLHLLSFCLNSLKLVVPVSETVSYQDKAEQEIFDLRGLISSKNRSKTSSCYKAVAYYQVFGNAFVSNLSLIDLLFCAGPASLQILKASQKVDLNK
jgi:predicted component of viral defense system (DUF524 family)